MAAEFSMISGAPEAVARDYLARAGGNLELALSNFFERTATGAQDNFAVDPAAAPIATATGTAGTEPVVSLAERMRAGARPGDAGRALRAPLCGLFLRKPPATSVVDDLMGLGPREEDAAVAARQGVPLVGARAEATVRDFAAAVALEQRFVNAGDAPVELVYRLRLEGSSSSSSGSDGSTLPVGTRAAVTGFEVTTDGKTVRAECQEKAEAADTYDDAIASGHRGVLVEKDKKIPDTFTMLVGNVAPGSEVTVKVEYVSELLCTPEGDVELLLPTGGVAPSTDEAEKTGDAKKDTGSGLTGLQIRVSADSTRFEFESVACPSHEPEVIQPLSADVGPWTTAGKSARAAFSLTGGGAQDARLVFALKRDGAAAVSPEGANVTAVLQQAGKGPADTDGKAEESSSSSSSSSESPAALMLSFQAEVDGSSLSGDTPTELIFVVDRSGSMAGSRMRNCQQALQLFLRSLPLRAVKFNIVSFGDRHESLFPGGAVLYDDASLARASAYVASMSANMGGTNILSPLKEVLTAPSTTVYGSEDDVKIVPRQVFLLTDGDVSNTAEVVTFVERNLGPHARVFGLGIGADASRDLVVGVATAGRGDADFVSGSSDSGDAGDTIQRKVLSQVRAALRPVLRSLRVDFGKDLAPLLSAETRQMYGLDGDDDATECTRLPPVFAGQRCVLYAMLKDDDPAALAAFRAKCALPAADGAVPAPITITAETDAVDEEATDPLEKLFTEEHEWTIPLSQIVVVDDDAASTAATAASKDAQQKPVVPTLATVALLAALSPVASKQKAAGDAALRDTLAQLALRAGIASKYTSLVAVVEATGEAAEDGLKTVDVADAAADSRQGRSSHRDKREESRRRHRRNSAGRRGGVDGDALLMQERERAVREVERDVAEVNEIFADVRRLVEEQGQQIDSIEDNVCVAADTTAAANTSLAAASRASGGGGGGGGSGTGFLSSIRRGFSLKKAAPASSRASAAERSQDAAAPALQASLSKRMATYVDTDDDDDDGGDDRWSSDDSSLSGSGSSEASLASSEDEEEAKAEAAPAEPEPELEKESRSSLRRKESKPKKKSKDAKYKSKSAVEARYAPAKKQRSSATSPGFNRASAGMGAGAPPPAPSAMAFGAAAAASGAAPPPPPGGPVAPAPVVAPPAPATGQLFVDVPYAPDKAARPLDRLVMLQRADGGFVLDSRLMAETGLTREACVAAVEKLCTDKEDAAAWSWALATALALAIFAARFGDAEEEWSMCADKATKRLRRACARGGAKITADQWLDAGKALIA